MKNMSTSDIPKFACIALFVWFVLRNVGNDIAVIGYYLGHGTFIPALSRLMSRVGYILIPFGIFSQRRKLSVIGCALLAAAPLIAMVRQLFRGGIEHSYDIYWHMSMLFNVAAMCCAALNCSNKKISPVKLGLITMGLQLADRFCLLLYNNQGHVYINFLQTYNEIYTLVSLPALTDYLTFFLLGYSFKKSSQKIAELPFLKNLPEVTFSEVASTYLATLIIPTLPMAFIFYITSPVLGLLTLIIAPVAFTYAHLLDKPAREKQEAEMAELRTKLFVMQLQDRIRNGGSQASSAPVIDTELLRKDMMDYYGTAMYSGSPMAQADLIHVQRASDAELISQAQKNGFDLDKYTY